MFIITLYLPFMFAACSSNEPSGEGGGDSGATNKVLGKRYKYLTADESGTTNYVIEFPHSRVCVYRNYGVDLSSGSYSHTDYYSYTVNYYSYTVSGSKIKLYDPATEALYYTLIYSSGKLTDAENKSVIYFEDGEVDLDESLGNVIPPTGKRTYIPVGWYNIYRVITIL